MNNNLRPLRAHAEYRGVGGGDIRRIYQGDWHSLWLEKTLQAEADDKTWSFPVQMGIALEPVLLNFWGHETNRTVLTGADMSFALTKHDHFRSKDGRFTFVHPTLEWVIASPDGVGIGGDQSDQRLVEAKSTNYWSATKDTPNFVRKHTPQITWYMETLAKPVIDLVFHVDNQRIEIHTVEFDEGFACVLLAEAEEFWHHVVRGIEPRKGRPERTVPAPRVAASRIVNMLAGKEGNAWTDAARRWDLNRQAAKAFIQAEKDIKELVPADAKEAYGAGIKATRNKAGAVTISNKE